MAVSMKDLDPAFQGVGNKAGLEIWRIEKSHSVAIPRSQYGKFCSGQAYVILQTRALKSGVFHHDIHYWLGKSTSQDEAAAAAVKAVELDAALGGRAVQFREVEGNETDRFLSYFKPCFIPTEEGVPSGINKAEGGVHQNRLFVCKGRHVVRVKEVPFSRSSLSHDNVFVLDTEAKIFQFNGANTDIHQRAKALDVVQYLKDNFHKKECQVAIIEDGKFVADADSGEFWGLFGGFAPLGRKLDNEGDSKAEITAGVLFGILEGQAKKMEEPVLQRETLNTNKCYILDCGIELFTWVGRDTSLEERKTTILVAEELIANEKKFDGIHLTCSIEGFEPREFKSKFKLWPVSTALPISEDGRGKVAVLLKQKGFDVKGLLKAAPRKEQSLQFSSAGKLQVWRINGSLKEAVPPSEYGKFYNCSCYIVLYTYPGDQKEEHLLCSWLGHQSTPEAQESCAQFMDEIVSSLQENAVEVRIFEGKEPHHFLSLFDKLFIIKGDEKDIGVRLFEVRQSGPQNWQATQIASVATSLNSSGCYFLQMEDSFFTWYGKFSTLEEQEATENMVHCLQPDASTATLKEGSETEVFWDALGGKKVHPSHREPKESAKDPRLFSCTLEKGQLKVMEVFIFTQENLLNDEVMILDCYTDVFVWIGQNANVKHKKRAFEIGEKYLEQAAVYESISMETPLYKIIEGSEPSLFTSFFSWDSSQVMHHLNPFQRKVLLLKGQSVKATEVTKSRRRSPMSDSRKEVADKSRFSRNSIFKVEQSPEKIRAPRSKPGNGRSPGRSPAVSAISSMFEFQNGREAPPNTPIVKLPALKTKEKESPSTASSVTTPSPRTPRPVASPRSPAIAALASIFETYSDKRLAFAWPGVKPRSEEGGREVESYGRKGEDTEEEEQGVTDKMEATRRTATEDDGTNDGSTDGTTDDGKYHPYERLKVSSPNPLPDIDRSRREAYLSDEEFQETFHMDKDTFYKLPKWKQDKYKILMDLF